jgi:hypothetical protein
MLLKRALMNALSFNQRVQLALRKQPVVEQRVEVLLRKMLGQVFAEGTKEAALRNLRRRRNRGNESFREQASDDCRGEKVAGLRGIANPGANSGRRHQGAQEQPGLRGALRIDQHLRVRADRENGSAPKARQVERSLHRVAPAAIGVKQWFALRRKLIVKSKYLSRPWRRAQHGDLFLQRLQSGKIDGVILEIDDCGTEQRRRDNATRGEISEDS